MNDRAEDREDPRVRRSVTRRGLLRLAVRTGGVMLLAACAPAAPAPTAAPAKPTEAPKPAAPVAPAAPTAATAPAPAAAPATMFPKKVLFGIGITAPYAPFIVAVEKGFMKQQGVDASYKLFETGGPGTEAVLAGQAEVGMSSEFSFGPLLARSDKMNVVSLGNIAGKDLGVVVSSKINEPKDLEGKSVGTVVRTSAMYWMHKFFDKHKIDASKVDVKNVGAPEMVPALARGDIDAYFVFGVWIQKGPEVVPGAKIMAYSGDDNVFVQKQALLFNNDFITTNLDTAAATLKGIDATYRWMKNNLDESAQISGTAFRVEAETIKPFIEAIDYVVRLKKEDIEEYEASTRWMIEQGSIQLKPEDVDSFWGRAVNTSVIKKALPEATDL